MRKSRSETALTRQKIVKEASMELRLRGIASAGVAEVMTRSGLTPGAFYRHFSSKNQLIAEATAEAADHMIQRVTKAVADRESKTGLSALLDSYVSVRHRNQIDSGCPFAAIGTELTRADDAIRDVATDGFLKLVHLVAAQLTGATEEPRKRRALATAASMVGALMMSRVVSDSTLSEEILDSVRELLGNE
ncbi:TetR/AcrR family transcriptional regulator [Paraburkholderia sp. ZP32-5]|uniref:TetR/AcrR family transcriptional regulator n=1 Tax=Paraburkholderia sp. ZP32-5 TaxID=2883245 RepID=UPI001F24EF76|nr:TetR/AcrR family transcriptional regulator [Paraburkholderia sp. ZP32-5]